MPSKELAMTTKKTSPYSLKNILLAVGMIFFLAMSFKLAGGLTDDPTSQNTMSASDSVFSSLQTPTAEKTSP